MFDPTLEYPVVRFAHDQVYVPRIVIEEGLAQGRAISDGGVVCLSFRYRQQHHTLTEGFSHFVTSIAAPVASGWSVCWVGFAPTGERRLCTAHTQS